jgi:hypothetical protein
MFNMTEQNVVTEGTTEEQTVPFKTVADYVVALEALGEDAIVSAVEVAETLKAIAAVTANGGKRRGQLTGLALEDMTLEQLKREKINAGSVHYKAEKRGAPAETVARNKARLDAVVARINELQPAAPVESTDEAVASAEVSEDVAAEI